MRRGNHFLAIALVSAALCADRAVAAAPVLRPHVAAVAGKLVTRLSVSFQRVLPTVRVYESRQDRNMPAEAGTPTNTVDDAFVCFVTRLSPLLLRLPPPAV